MQNNCTDCIRYLRDLYFSIAMDCIYEHYHDRLCKVVGCKNKALRLIIDIPESICRVCADHYHAKEKTMEFPYICWTHNENVYDLDLIQLHPVEMINHLSYFLAYHLILYHDHVSKGEYNIAVSRHLGLPPKHVNIELQRHAIEKIQAADEYTPKYFGTTIKGIYNHIKTIHQGYLSWRKFGVTWFISFDDLFYLNYDQSLYGILDDIYRGFDYKKLCVKKITNY